jgi:major membrane immunogen (membrane-anchored lipoprotein)
MGGGMKRLAVVMILAFLTGCATPMHGFTATTTSEGVNGYRMVYKDYDKPTVNAYLEYEMGRTKTCPHGWVQAKEEITPQGFIVLEGQCK